MSTMTMEQVRDELRGLASDGMFGIMADAIDAHLAAREADAVPVTWVHPQSLRNLADGSSTREWMWAEKEEGDIPLYAAPVAKEAAAPAEQAVGDGVVAYAIVDPYDMEIEQLCTSKDELEQWRVEGTEIVPLCFATPRPAVAAHAEVTDEMVERAAKGMWDSVPRGIEWPGASESISRDWRFLARAALKALAAHPPTGHSAVPEEPQGCDENANVSYRYGYRSGWIACRKAVLAAAPEVN